MDCVRLEILRMGRGEQVCWQDERAEDVVCRGCEDRGAVWRPLGAFEVVAFILGLGPLCWAEAGFRVVTEQGGFFDGCFGYAALIEVSCCTYELRLGMVEIVHGGCSFLIVRGCIQAGPYCGALTMQSSGTYRKSFKLGGENPGERIAGLE